MITKKSAKAKARKCQDLTRDGLKATFPQFEEDDIKSTIMGSTGSDILLSPAAVKVIPYSFECKNVEKLNIWSALEQAEKNAKVNTEPVLVFRRNRSKTYAVVEFDTFLKLIK